MNSRLFSSLQLSPFVSLNEFSTSTGSRPKGRGFAFVGLCNIGLKFAAAVAFTSVMHAQTNLLFNGDLESNKPITFYYDNAGSDTGTKSDVPGWEAFAVGDSSSWVKIATDTNTLNTDLNLNGTSYSAPFPYLGLAGIKTAVSNRVAVASGAGYYATVTHDNYYASAGISYFIDWFDAGDVLLGSSGGPLGDPNGPGTFAPFTQQFTISGIAPANATRAGVRLESSDGDPDYASGATADNLLLAVQPVLNMRQSGGDVILSWTKGPSFGLEQTGDLSGAPVWTYLGTQNPQTIPMTSSNAFFRLVGP